MVQAPRSLPRIIRLPERLSTPGNHDYVFLSSIIREHIAELFPGLEVSGCYQFRATRNSNLYVDDEEVGHECPADLQQFLLDHFQLQHSDMFLVEGPVNLNRLATVCDIEDKAELAYPPFVQSLPPELIGKESIFSLLSKKNVLLHHPYHSFAPVIDFIRSAATDDDVLAIKMTLYRTGPGSPIVDHLVTAARSGKEVTVAIELMARFDEAANIARSTRRSGTKTLRAPRHRKLSSRYFAGVYRLRLYE